jgi:hypothetical protein
MIARDYSKLPYGGADYDERECAAARALERYYHPSRPRNSNDWKARLPAARVALAAADAVQQP